MRNTQLLARLYEALHEGDDEDEKDWQAVDASPVERGTRARLPEPEARAFGPSVNEGGYVGTLDIRINLGPRGNHTFHPPRAWRRS